MKRVLLVVSLLLLSNVASAQGKGSPQIAIVKSAISVQMISPKPTAREVDKLSLLFTGLDSAAQAVEPYLVTCDGVIPSGSGRWEGSVWTYYFGDSLAAGSKCKATLDAQAGEALEGIKDREFSFTIPGSPTECQKLGASVLSLIPDTSEESVTIVKENEFYIATFDCPVTEAALVKNTSVSVEGLGDQIPVSVITGTTRDNILTNKKLKSVANQYVFQATRPLPPHSDVTVTIQRIMTAGKASEDAEPFVAVYKVRPRFEVTMQCEHSFADGSCDPFLPMYAVFSTKPQSYYDENYEYIKLKGILPGQSWPGEEIKDFPIEDGMYGSALKFKAPFPTGSTFTVDIPAEFKDEEGRVYAGPQTLTVKTGKTPPMVRFSGTFGVLERYTNSGLPITVRSVEPIVAMGSGASTTSNKNELQIRAIKVSEPAKIINYISSVQRHYEKNTDGVYPPALLSESSAEVQVEKITRPNSKEAFEVLGLPFLQPGFYVVEADSDAYVAAEKAEGIPSTQVTSVLVTDLAVHSKLYNNKALVWVTSLKTGASVPGAQISVNDCHGVTRGTSTTGADGVAEVVIAPAKLPLNSDGQPDQCDFGYFSDEVSAGMPSVDLGTEPLFIQATTSDDSSFVLSSWSKGLESWRFALGSSYYDSVETVKQNSGGYVAQSVLPRNLLRRGETAFFKHIIRQKTNLGLALLKTKPDSLTASLRHNASGDLIDLPTTFENGSFALNEWKIPETAKLGDYSISLALEAGGTTTTLYTGAFSVLDYKVPLMRGSISNVADVKDDKVEVDASVAYLAGGGAAGQQVLLRYRYEPFEGDISEKYADYDFLGSAMVKLDEETAEVSQQQDYSLDPVQQGTMSQRKTLDTSGSARFALADLVDIKKPVNVRTELEFRDDNGDVQTISRKFLKLPQKRILGARKNSWLSSSGKYVFDIVELDSDGAPVANAPIVATISDTKLFAYRKRMVGGFYSYEEAEENKNYGQACKGVTNASGVLRCEIAIAQAGNYTVTFSSPEATLPVAVTMSDGDLWFAQENSDRFDLLPERTSYEPGDSATFQLRLPFLKSNVLFTFEQGGVLRHVVQPFDRTQSTVSLPVTTADVPNVFVSALAVRGRIDEAKPTSMFDPGRPALREGYAQLKVGRKPLTLDVSVSSDKKQYHPRDPVEVSVTVSHKISEAVMPLAAGSQVALAVIDDGLLELKKNDTWDLLDNIVGPTDSPGVQTVTNQLLVIGKRHFGLKGLPFGGGGGKGLTRELFDTLVYWNPTVALDEKGAAKVSFPLNDSITSFRVVAVATSEGTLFGKGAISIVSSKDVILEPALPTIVREGDSVQIDATVRNTTNDAHAVTISGIVGKQTLEPKGAALSVTTPSAAISWQLIVPSEIDSLPTELNAAEDAKTVDAIKKSIVVLPRVPVLPIGSSLVDISRNDTGYTIPLELPVDAANNKGGVRVSISNSYAAADDALKTYMETYPYTCLEQKLSKATVTGKQELWNPLLEQLPAYVDSRGLARFFKGIGRGDLELTTYALTVTKAAGKKLDADVESKLVAALQKSARGSLGVMERGSTTVSSDKLFTERWQSLAALSFAGKSETAIAQALFQFDGSTRFSTLVDMLAVASTDKNIKSAQVKAGDAVDAVVQEIIKRMHTSVGGNLLGGDLADNDSYSIFSPDTVQAKLLYVLAKLQTPKPALKELVDKVALQLASRISKSGLANTTANTWAHLAFALLGKRAEGTVTIIQDKQTRTVDFAKEPLSVIEYNWQQPSPIFIFKGSGGPIVVVQRKAAIPLTTAVNSGISLSKPQMPATVKVGDIIEVTLKIQAENSQHWVVVDDPLPPGAVLLDGTLSNSLAPTDAAFGNLYADYVESGRGQAKIYFSYLQKGMNTYKYRIRLTTRGIFSLPATVATAMYAPDTTFGILPNGKLTVE